MEFDFHEKVSSTNKIYDNSWKVLKLKKNSRAHSTKKFDRFKVYTKTANFQKLGGNRENKQNSTDL